MDKKESALLAGQTVFVYLFVEKETDKVIYVGTTRHIGRRLNEHRNFVKDSKYKSAIYVYMRENNLSLFDDVEVRIVAYFQNREEAANYESELIAKYSETTQNNVKVDTRKYNTDLRLVKIKCLETGTIYHAAEPLARQLGISRYMLDKHINNSTPIAGNHYEWVK